MRGRHPFLNVNAVQSTPGMLRESGAAFAPTHWSAVQRAMESQAPVAAQEALTQLYQAYWPPLYSFVRRRGYSSADAQDLVQGFFVHILERKTLARADPGKGKFRSFLLGALKLFLADAYAHAHALKRGGGQQFVTLEEELLDGEIRALAETPPVAPGGSASDEERLFEQRWATALVSRALEKVRAESAAANGDAALLEALLPLVTGVPPLPAQGALATRFGLPPATVPSHVHRLRGRFRAASRAEVARTVATRAEIDEELRYLCHVLAAAG